MRTFAIPFKILCLGLTLSSEPFPVATHVTRLGSLTYMRRDLDCGQSYSQMRSANLVVSLSIGPEFEACCDRREQNEILELYVAKTLEKMS